MMDKSTPTEPLFFALTGHGVVALHGRDALAFAQAQTMNDVMSLANGQWQWNGWLTPKGRLVALFALLRRDAETVWLLLPDADAAALCAQLQRFVFRSKVVVAVRDDLHVGGAFRAPMQAAGAMSAVTGEDAVELDLGGEGGPRTLRIHPGPAPRLDAASADRWTAFDLRHGLPRLPDSQSGQWTPQQLSLDRLRAYSVKKGCYPGQEIVARTHFLGKAKRGLARLGLDQAVAAGTEVRIGDRAIGTLVSTAPGIEGVGSQSLAVMPGEFDAQCLHIDDAGMVRIEPLLEGLAR